MPGCPVECEGVAVIIESWCELGLLYQMVLSELVSQCDIQGGVMDIMCVGWSDNLLYSLMSGRRWIWSVGVRVVLALSCNLLVPGWNLHLCYLILG